MEEPIPQEWVGAVLRILENGRFEHEIICPRGVAERWDTDTLGNAFLCDVRQPLIQALRVPDVIGMLIANQPEPGDTYAFWFYYKVGEINRKFYGKICLYHDKIKLKLLSAHLPNKGEERL